MCGIIAAFNKDAKTKKSEKTKTFVNEWVLSQFEDQKDRGTQGYGIVAINEDMSFVIHRATEGYKFMYDIHENLTHMMMMHHRIPTSTGNKMRQTHPMVVSNGSLAHDYLVVHNGVIRNDKELKKKHEELGFLYSTETEEYHIAKFNDSEAFAIELSLFIEGQKERIEAEGSAAFTALQIDKKTQKVEKFYFGRNDGNPLKLAKTRGSLRVSSEGPGDDVTPGILYSCSLLDNEMRLSKKTLHFPIKIIQTTQREFGYNTKSIDYHSEKYWEEQMKKRDAAYEKKWGKDDVMVKSKWDKENDILYNQEEHVAICEDAKEDNYELMNYNDELEAIIPDHEIEESMETIEQIIEQFIGEMSYVEDPGEIDIETYVENFKAELEKLKRNAQSNVLEKVLAREANQPPILL
jgi:predicted glutamine amidotransferase